ncbi:hypothetical protein [Streptomyces paludis]|uniref:Uncharacterized protein n=1 Tax=Streptomyces paludis TaxID=2282738 RepID=A0A345HYU6_9ACTN|nr:hypothetical protein [Streptomyces paludis]AXG81870.1 hypothetical protein DVK44_33715 [Streptomyces paludis]
MTATMTTPPATGAPAVRRRSVRAIRVYWPVSRRTLAAVGTGDIDVLRDDDSFAELLRVLESAPSLGDFGLYGDVFEVSIGAEGFTARPGSAPVFGAVGGKSLSPTLTFTTYLDARTDDEEISRVLSLIVGAHPWETPVVELSAPLELVSRAQALPA